MLEDQLDQLDQPYEALYHIQALVVLSHPGGDRVSRHAARRSQLISTSMGMDPWISQNDPCVGPLPAQKCRCRNSTYNLEPN